MTNITELALTYVQSYKDCFHAESTESWISRFGGLRWDNTILDHEVSEEERLNKGLRQLFVDEFTKAMLVEIKNKNVIVDENGKKKTLVKRKRD